MKVIVAPAWSWRLWTALVVVVASVPPLAYGATAIVEVGDNFFRPAVTNIATGDTVRWNWIGFQGHTTTHSGSPRLWDSGLRGNGATFSFVFNNAGSYPYLCTVPGHFGQNGTINVASPNTPPTVTLRSPINGAVYATPGNVRLAADAADANGTVTNVQFFRGATSLGNDASAPYEFTDMNPPQGAPIYSAVASDNGGARATNSVSVSVVSPVPIQLANPQKPSANQFRFTYSGNVGLSYFVQKSSDLGAWQTLGTNRATAPNTTFTDDSAGGGRNLYRVGRVPNP